MEEKTSDKREPIEEKTEMSIDNEPDKIDFSKFKGKVKENPWIIVSIVLGVIIVVLLFLNFRGGITGNVISDNDAGRTVVEYLNSMTGGGVEYVSHEDLGNLYEISVSYRGSEVPVFITKDGQYFIQSVVPITGEVIQPSQTQQPVDIVKSDKPQVELFVMTHCPYGTQAEKGMVPVFELLGDKIDSSVKFVHYFLHDPEEDETPLQICIREEQADKYLDYLKCFLKDGDSDRCLRETEIDKTKLNSCISDNADDYYNEDSELSQGYGVGGSPTLIINGQIVSSERDSASYLDVICSAFIKAPEECDGELSSQNPSPGFGYSTVGGSNSAAGSC